MVRRRVPAGDAEDVAQTILCDALGAPALPSDPTDLRRFVAGIARHKVADFHRRLRRNDVNEVDDLVVDPPPVEARALLARIVSSIASVRERETLEWLVREHDGEQLRTIAEETGIPAPAVRQRVSRLRRVLRAQWAHALALLVVAGSCAALAERHHPGDAIVADPGDPVARAAGVAQGQWHVERVEHVASPESAREALEAKVVDIRIRGRRITVTGPLVNVTRTVSAATTLPDGAIAIELRDGDGEVQHATAAVDGNRMLLTIHDGRLRGTARLVRR